MADESENGKEPDFEAPIWNEDRTAMIRYVGYDPDREFGGGVYEFIMKEDSRRSVTGSFVFNIIDSAFDNYLKKRGIDPLNYFLEMGIDEYSKESKKFKKYGARFIINKLYFFDLDSIEKISV